MLVSVDAKKPNPIQTQNKPNFRNAQMNVTSSITKDYENVRLHRRGETKPNSKPISLPLSCLLSLFYQPQRASKQSETCPARIRRELIFNRCGFLNLCPRRRVSETCARAGGYPLPPRRKQTSHPSTAKLGVLRSFRPAGTENRRLGLQFSCFKVLRPNNR